MKAHHIVMLFWLVGAATALGLSSPATPLETVPHVDLQRYAGRWFEIARFPNGFERKCDRNVTADYTVQPSGTVRVVNSCLKADGATTQSKGTAKIADPASNAKLKVTFFWPFYGNYWVIDLGKDYDYAVVGEPTRHYLWILSRSPAVPDLKYQEIVRNAAQQGYDTSKLVKTTQTAK